jgi:hypothetical protein
VPGIVRSAVGQHAEKFPIPFSPKLASAAKLAAGDSRGAATKSPGAAAFYVSKYAKGLTPIQGPSFFAQLGCIPRWFGRAHLGWICAHFTFLNANQGEEKRW